MLRLGVVSDIHLCPEPERVVYWHNKLDFAGVADRLRAALAYFGEKTVDAVVLLGDLSHDGDSDSLEAVLSTCAEQWSGPMFVVAGNHDIVGELPDLPGDLASNVVVSKLAVELETETGSLTATETAFAASSEPLVLLSHYPLHAQAALFEARGFKHAGRVGRADEVLAGLLARNAPSVVLCGHLHARASHAERHLLQLTFAALVEPPFECAIVEIETGPDRLDVHRHSHRLAGPVEAAEPVFVSTDETWTVAEGEWVCAISSGEVERIA